jgi:AcrR family transcriptional regulator
VPYDVEATRRRLVDAAVAEFAAFGLAGGRVDRIAAMAQANKRAIYDYFSNKEGLFEVALGQVIDELNSAVPLLPDDLPRYAANLFDYLLAHPEAVRLIAWRRLERPSGTSSLDENFVRRLIVAHDHADPACASQPIGSIDLVVLIIGLANAWHLSGADLLAATGERPADLERLALHRSAVIEAAGRISNTAHH